MSWNEYEIKKIECDDVFYCCCIFYPVKYHLKYKIIRNCTH